MSRQLRALERHLQAQLLRRSTRHVSLTEVGRAYYEDCKRILADVDSTEGNLGALRRSLRGTLRVNTSVAMGLDCVAPLAFAFQKRHPELAVDLTLNERFVNLVEEGIGVAIRFGPIGGENVVARRLAATRRATVAAPAYLRRHGAPMHPEELSAHACIAFNYEPAEQWIYLGPRGESRVTVPAIFRSNNGHVVRGALLAGLGIGWLPEALLHQQLQAGKLKPLMPAYSMASIEVHAVYSPARRLPEKVRAFVAYLEQQLAIQPGSTAPA